MTEYLFARIGDIDAFEASLADHIADPTAAHAASAISVTPSGTLAATDVAAALTEILGDIETHVADASAAHAASAISFAATGSIAATDVQTAIAEVATDYLAAISALSTVYQPLDADLTSWAAITRAAGFDTFVATPSLANLGSLLTDEAAGLITFMTTPSSANLATLVTDETGSGLLVFATAPTLTSVVITSNAANFPNGWGNTLKLTAADYPAIWFNGVDQDIGVVYAFDSSTNIFWLEEVTAGATVGNELFWDFNNETFFTGDSTWDLGKDIKPWDRLYVNSIELGHATANTLTASGGTLSIEGVALATAASVSDHLADATDAHDASAISVAPSGTLAADDVQEALLEILGDIETHVADGTAAHAASAISFAPNGSIAATDVQSAIVEVRDEAQPLDADLTAIAALTTTAYGRSLLELADETALEALLDTLPNLVSVQGRTVTLADAGANAFFGWDDVAGAYENLTAAEALAIILTVDGAGSGLDADLLDGQSSAFYATATSVSDHLADAVDAHDASAISSVAAGNLSSTDVQSALNELDTEKQPLDADLTAIAALTTTAYGRSLLELADETALEALLDTLPNLVSIQGLTVTLADAGADAFFGWDDSAGAYENLTASEALEIIKTVDGAGSGLDADLLDGKTTGTSGNTVPLLDGANTWSALQTFTAGIVMTGTLGLNIAVTAASIASDPASGYFGTFEAFSGTKIQLTQSEVQAADESGGWRSALSLYHQDSDATDYEAIAYRTISDGMRVGVFGPNDGLGTYSTSSKDFHGVTSQVIARTDWTTRGVASFAGDSVQFGEGVCLNEVTMSNPSGSSAQASQIAGWLITLSGKQAAADASHTVHGLTIINVGKKATTVLEAYSAGTDGDNGQFGYVLKLDNATVDTGAILMPASAATDVGTRIIYETGSWSAYDRTGNAFTWALGSANVIALDGATFFPAGDGGASLGYATLAWQNLHLNTGGTINWENGDVVITHSSNTLAFSGASSGYTFTHAILPSASDGAAIGSATLMWSDAFLASGAVINFNNGNVTLTHSAARLDFTGASVMSQATSGTFPIFILERTDTHGDAAVVGSLQFYGRDSAAASQFYASFYASAVLDNATAEEASFSWFAVKAGSGIAYMDLTGTALSPGSSDLLALGTTSLMWSDAFFASGAVLNFNNGNSVITHSAAVLTVSTGDLRVTTAGTNAASVVTVGGTQTLTAKTLTSPTIITSPTAAGATWTDLGTVTTADINGGTIDGTVIGGASAAAITGTTITVNTNLVPDANDGAGLGLAATAFSDLFLASGAVIGFNNGDVTLTHAANLLIFDGGTIITTHTAASSAYHAAGITPIVQISGTDINNSSLGLARYSADANGTYIAFGKSRHATNGSHTIVQSGDVIATLSFGGSNGTAFDAAAYIIASIGDTPGASADMPGQLSFYTSSNASATPTERMRITSANQIMLLDTSLYFTVSGDVPLLNFDGNDYWAFDRSDNAWTWILAGNNLLALSATGVNINASQVATANNWLKVDQGAALTVGTNTTYAFAIVQTGTHVYTVGSGGGHTYEQSWNAQPFHINNQGNDLFLAEGADGVQCGAPTGGDKGNGTVNAKAVYDDNTLLTCIPVQKEFLDNGTIDKAYWNSKTPDAPKKFDEDKKELPAEPMEHPSIAIMEDLMAAGYDPRNPTKYCDYLYEHNSLPGMPTRANWVHNELSQGQVMTRLWLAAELLAVSYRTSHQEMETLKNEVALLKAKG